MIKTAGREVVDAEAVNDWPPAAAEHWARRTGRAQLERVGGALHLDPAGGAASCVDRDPDAVVGGLPTRRMGHGCTGSCRRTGA